MLTESPNQDYTSEINSSRILCKDLFSKFQAESQANMNNSHQYTFSYPRSVRFIWRVSK